jgi:hypothetical protein
MLFDVMDELNTLVVTGKCARLSRLKAIRRQESAEWGRRFPRSSALLKAAIARPRMNCSEA